MSAHQTIAVAVRLFAIWLAIYFGRMVPSFYRETLSADDSAAGFAAIVIALLAVVLILFLWFFPRTVARGLLDAKNLSPADAGTPDTWLAVGCALIGIWLIVPALARIIYNLSVVYMAQRNSAVDTSDLHFAWTYYLVEIAFGAWLVLGARGARRLFWWARRGKE